MASSVSNLRDVSRTSLPNGIRVITETVPHVRSDSTGGNLDAYTAKELVSYNIKVLDEHLPIAFDILSDLVLQPRFDAADIEKEKGVILEELKMEVDNPEYL